MPVTYILFSNKVGKFYIGSSHSDNIETRLARHNSGGVRSTKFGRPWTVVEIEKFSDYTMARKRELFLKSGVGRALIYKKHGGLSRKAEECPSG